MKGRMFLGLLLAILMAPAGICPQSAPDFSGTWTLIENGAALQRVRERVNGSPDGAGKQTLVYLREAQQT
jgi:hypothetical protein